MTINDLRSELQAWGKFWAEMEALQGYANKSVTARCCELLQTGIWASSDRLLFSHHADNIYVPWYIKRIDDAVVQLPVPQRAVITKRYIKTIRLSSTERLALLNAEMTLFGEVF